MRTVHAWGDRGRALYTLAIIFFALLGASTAQAANATALWDANPEPDIAGYVLSWGTTSGVYPNSMDVGNVTTYTVTSLTAGQQYYFVVKAYNTSGLSSANSAPVPFTPLAAPIISLLSPGVGSAGTPVTITGSNFGATQGSSTVKFNGTTATPTSWSTTTIVAPVPVGATTGQVVVTVGGVASNTVIFTVNRPPTLNSITSKTNAENDTVSLQLVGSDPDGNALTYSATNLPGGLGVNASTGLISGTLSYTSAGSYSVTATVSDGSLTASRTFTWTVTNVNRAPTLSSVSNKTNAENATVSLQLAGSDPDGDTLTYSATNLPGGLGVNASTGLISGTIAYSSAGTYSVTATVSDGSLTASRTFTWTVTNVNRAPTLSSISNKTNAENATVSVQLAGSDPDGDTLTYSATNLPGGLGVNASTGLISGTLTYSSAGSYNVTATVSDGSLTASRTFTWTVTNVNRAPTLGAVPDQSNPVNGVVSLQLVGSDPDGDSLTYGANGLPAGLSVNAATGVISGTVTNTGTFTVTAAASDGSLSANRTFTWTVTSVNRAPTLSAVADQSNNEGAAVAVQLVGSDPDGDTLTYSATGLPGSLAIDPSTGLIAGTISSAAGPYQVSATVSDGTLSATQNFTWTVSAPAKVTNDFDGDGRSDVVVYRPSQGTWHILLSRDDFTTAIAASWGTGADEPVPADYDGDGITDVAVYAAKTGLWQMFLSGTGSSASSTLGGLTSLPVPADFDGDGRADVAVYQASNGTWTLQLSGDGTTSVVTWGSAKDAPVPGDYDGDGKADVATYRPSTGLWQILRSSDGTSTTVSLGGGTAEPIAADYDGDGQTDPAVYEPSTGLWSFKLSSTGTTSTRTLGGPTSSPVRGDYDGDGRTDVAVFREDGFWQIAFSGSGSTWTPTWGWLTDQSLTHTEMANFASVANAVTDLANRNDFDGDGRSDIVVYRPSEGTWHVMRSKYNFSFAMAVRYNWGQVGDTPVPGDYDGDGKTDLGVRRPDGQWVIALSSTDFAMALNTYWGYWFDIAVPGDYDGDGITDIAVYRPAPSTWYVMESHTGFTTAFAVPIGADGSIPAPGDYDGDGRTDMATFDSTTGAWQILYSASNYTTSRNLTWGGGVDVPVPGDFDGDGLTDIAVYRSTDGTWNVLRSSSNFTTSFAVDAGTGTTVPVTGDYDGDKQTDIATFDTANGTWTIWLSSTGYASTMTTVWGWGTDLPQALAY